MSILIAINVDKSYGAGDARVHALRGASLTIVRGEFLAVMGPSGCGKSTLLQLLGGIDAPSSGQILLEGRDLGAMSDAARSLVRRRRIGFIFQKINLLSTLSAAENAALPLRIDGVSRSTALTRARGALEQVGVAHRANHLPHEMSGGEQQRVAIARALLIDPAVILADEPTGALDSANAALVADLLRDCARQGRTILMVTHDPRLAGCADRIVAMSDGRIVSHDAANTASPVDGHAACDKQNNPSAAAPKSGEEKRP